MASTPDTQLLSAYLADGEDRLKREAVIRRLRNRLEREGDLSFNSDTFDGAVASGEAIASACRTLPFASAKRLVTVNAADKLGKKAQAALVDYLKDPSETTVLLLSSDKLAKNTALYKAVKAVGPKAIIDCTPPKKKDLAKQVSAMAPSHGITLTPQAAAALVELVGEDTVHLDAELEKLAIANAPVTDLGEREVRALVARVAEVKPWQFVDAFAARDLSECIRLSTLMPSVSPFALLRQCVGRIRELMCAQSMLAQGAGAERKVAEALSLPDWKVRSHLKWARGWKASDLRRGLASSIEAEKKMKSGSDPAAAFLDWTIGVLRP